MRTSYNYKHGSIFIVGCGGHGKTVSDAILSSNGNANILFLDDNDNTHGSIVLGFSVIGSFKNLYSGSDFIHIAIGNNTIREEYFSQIEFNFYLSVIHPVASISKSARIDAGVFIGANAFVGADSEIGIGTIVNHGSIVDHDCSVGKFSHIAPGASLSGGVTVGSNVLIGTGARVLPGITIGNYVTIGAGAIVTKDVPNGSIAKGVPAVVDRLI